MDKEPTKPKKAKKRPPEKKPDVAKFISGEGNVFTEYLVDGPDEGHEETNNKE